MMHKNFDDTYYYREGVIPMEKSTLFISNGSHDQTSPRQAMPKGGKSRGG